MEVKTINALMKYLRDKHNINIKGSKDKLNLINIGYYHGYKGYRYIKKPSNKINLKNFDEYCSIIKFDSEIKSILYPQIMQIETITKNIVLQLLVEEYRSDEFNVIFEKGMTDYKNYPNDPDEYKNKMKHRLKVQNDIYTALSKNYSNNNSIVNHFYSADRSVPLWGIFEIIYLGNFADLIKSLELKTRIKISKKLGINIAFDSNGKFPEKIIYAIKSLRNAIAHNSVVFDVRFQDAKINKKLCKYLENETGCIDISFDTITDYIILIVFLLKNYGLSKTELNRLIIEFEKSVEDFRMKIPINIFNQIVYTNNVSKVKSLKLYIKK